MNKKYFINIREFAKSGNPNNSDDCLLISVDNPSWYSSFHENALSWSCRKEAEEVIKNLPREFDTFTYKYRIEVLVERLIKKVINDGYEDGYKKVRIWFAENSNTPIKIRKST